jgi:hypothetical protein
MVPTETISNLPENLFTAITDETAEKLEEKTKYQILKYQYL